MEQFLSAKFLSGRNANVKAGIVGYSTGKTLEVIGRVGIGSTIFDPIADLDVRGSTNISGDLYISNDITFGSEIKSNLIPNDDATYDVGNLSKRWRNAYFSGIGTFSTGLFADNVRLGVGGNGVVDTTSGSLYLDSAAGTTIINDNVQILGSLSVNLDSTFTSVTATSIGSSSISITGVGTIARIVSTAASFAQLQVTGISTFTNGPVFVGSGTSTGTASQRLQVTGGAYVSGSVGVAITNPREELDVVGDIGVQASGASNRFVIQHNNSLNSLDFIFV